MVKVRVFISIIRFFVSTIRFYIFKVRFFVSTVRFFIFKVRFYIFKVHFYILKIRFYIPQSLYIASNCGQSAFQKTAAVPPLPTYEQLFEQLQKKASKMKKNGRQICLWGVLPK